MKALFLTIWDKKIFQDFLKRFPQKGKVRENNLCLTVLFIFADLPLMK